MIMNLKRTKLCFTCSAGGHFQQLLLATKELSDEEYDIYWLMYRSKHLDIFFQKKRLHTVVNTTGNKFTWIVNAVQSLFYLIIERPDVIISTGAGASFPTIFLGKVFFKCKVIYICSAANVIESSRTPYKAYKYSDLFLVQWSDMQEIFPNSINIGVL